MKTKINFKNLCLLLLMALCIGLCLGDLFTALLCNGTYTLFGLMINFIEVFVVMMIEAELSNYLEVKNGK